MHHKKLMFLLQTGGLIMITVGVLLAYGQPVDAQCGSQASSCKNCHEVQAVDPVNNDGTGWHVSHAFGDFCYLCHAGNPQAADEAGAHTGMVPPLSDVEASCQQCHADDLTERAQVYATALNISFGTGGDAGGDSSSGSEDDAFWGESSQGEAAVDTASDVPQVVIGIPASNELVVDDPNLVDYVQRYNEIVLGERPVNMGNVVLVGLIAAVVLGGGGFVLVNEIRKIALVQETKAVNGEFPADVVEMLPAMSRLKVETRKAFGKLFANPKKADAVVGLLKTIDPEASPEDSAS